MLIKHRTTTISDRGDVRAVSIICGQTRGLSANTRRLTDVGTMLVQRRRRWTNIEPALVQRLVFAGQVIHVFGWRFRALILAEAAVTLAGYTVNLRAVPANTTRSTNVGLLLGQRRRQWSKIETTLGECIVFVEYVDDRGQFANH